MTKLLEEAIEKVRLLPANRQNDAAEILLTVVEQSGVKVPSLTEEQAAEVRSRLGNPQYASDEEVAAFFQKAGG